MASSSDFDTMRATCPGGVTTNEWRHTASDDQPNTTTTTFTITVTVTVTVTVTTTSASGVLRPTGS